MGLFRVIFLFALVLGGFMLARRLFGKGRKEQEIPTDRSGVLRKVTYHDNGRMASERYLMDGVMHGPYMLWDTQGNKIAEGEYRNGMLHGTEQRFGDDGRLIASVQWVEGRRTESRKKGADGELIELRLVDEVAVAEPVDENEHDPTST